MASGCESDMHRLAQVAWFLFRAQDPEQAAREQLGLLMASLPPERRRQVLVEAWMNYVLPVQTEQRLQALASYGETAAWDGRQPS